MSDPTISDPSISGPPATSSHPSTLTVSAVSPMLAVIRSVTESALYVADWRVDDVVDIRVALDELCSQIIARGADGTELTLRLEVGVDTVGCRVSGQLVAGTELDQSSFGWHVLRSISDEQTVAYDDSSLGGRRRGVDVTLGFTASK